MNGEISLDDWVAQQTPELQAAIHDEYLKSLQREEDLRAIRRLLNQSQAELATKLGTNQGTVSKLERKSDMTLKNLRSVVHHLGGKLDIVIRLPNRRPIRLEKLSDANVPSERHDSQLTQPVAPKTRKPRKPNDHPA